ncbi:MAG: glycerol-3-phosphate responsive antiterminator [Fusobacteriota bacterium]
MDNKFHSNIDKSPVIAAVKNKEGLSKALKSNVEIIFLLNSNITDLKSVIQDIKDANKLAFLHLDLISGLGRDKAALEYINKNINIDGIISTKSYLIKEAKKLGIYAIQRFFIFDSMSLKKAESIIESAKPDAIEILPGVIPKVIDLISKRKKIPIIASGLIDKKDEIYEGISAGATGISTTNYKIWNM